MTTGTWHNKDGLLQKFPDYYKKEEHFINRARSVDTAGAIKQLVIDYDLTKIANGAVGFPVDRNNDGTPDGFTEGEVGLPAYASVIRATVYATETAAGGTSFALGTFQIDGTAIDADGIVTNTEAVTANLARGERVYGNGAYVAVTAGTASIGANPGYLAITATGTFTAGKGRIVIEYLDPLA